MAASRSVGEPFRGNFVTFWHFLARQKARPVTSACCQLFLGAFVASEARAGIAVHFTLAEESYPNHIAMPYRDYSWTTRPTLRRSRARDDPSTTTDTPPPRPKTPPPLKPPAMAEADDDKKWYSKPNKRESLWGLGGMAVRPATRPCRLFPEPARVREYRPSQRGRFVPREFPRAFLA